MKPLALLLILAATSQAAPLPNGFFRFSGKPEISASPSCICHEKGFPCCDCCEGNYCRCVRLNPYAHLPPEKTCKACYEAALLWATGVEQEAKALGYYTEVSSGEWWERSRWIWIGGGPHAEAMRAEYQEAKCLMDAWFACWWITWPNVTGNQREEYEVQLRALIGNAAYSAGAMPPPIPYWRVPRR
jgi:hypothetical protein